eukprot:5298334-Pyramimonas_sp.AAC.1
MTDRRFSLAAAILRRSLNEVSIKRVKSEHMLADCLTKVLPGGHARMIVISNWWTLGPDDRAPSMRGRTLGGPEKVAANKEVDDLRAKMDKYVKQELYDDTDGNDEISTWPVEADNYVDECFYDDKGENDDETARVEIFYMDDATDNYPVDTSRAQRTVQ